MTDINALSRAELAALVVETLAVRGIEVAPVGIHGPILPKPAR